MQKSHCKPRCNGGKVLRTGIKQGTTRGEGSGQTVDGFDEKAGRETEGRRTWRGAPNHKQSQRASQVGLMSGVTG